MQGKSGERSQEPHPEGLRHISHSCGSVRAGTRHAKVSAGAVDAMWLAWRWRRGPGLAWSCLAALPS